MYGAIIGDINGSKYEWNNIKTKDFSLFSIGCFYTDDTALTLGTIDAILNNINYGKVYNDYFRKHDGKGYGMSFTKWCFNNRRKGIVGDGYNSLGNGSAMRVSPVGYIHDTIEETLLEAKKSAECTHNHPEGIKGAQAISSIIFYIRKGKDKSFIKNYVENTFNYDLSRKLDDIRSIYSFNETCPGSVPEAIIAFLESNSFEDAIRNAISIGGDSDTISCITGSMAEAYYGIPKNLVDKVKTYLDKDMLNLLDTFYKKYNVKLN